MEPVVETTAASEAAVVRRRGAKAPGFVFAGLAMMLTALLLAALSPSQPPPPPVAEYAPEAVQAIKDAPPEQSAEHGLAGGEAGGRTADDIEEEEELAAATTSSTTSTTLPPNSERVRQCVGNPPRQTEDPQSPPCVPYFDGDNGGGTSKGVTSDAIRVSFPQKNDPKHFNQMLNFFNNRFELYHRKVTVAKGGCFGGDPKSAQNTAIEVAKDNAFASSYFCDILGTESYYYDELARRGVVSVNGQASMATEADLAKYHPYQWSYLPTWDKGTRHLTELACSLKGSNARYAGPPFLTQPRKWGMLVNSFTDAPEPDYTAAMAALQACGVEVNVKRVQQERETQGGQGISPNTAQQVQNAVFEWQSTNVTSAIILTHVTTTRQFYATAEAQGYEPEILLSTYIFNDTDLISSFPEKQLRHTLGISVRNMQMAQVEDEFFWQAVNEGGNKGQPWDYAPFTYLGARFDYGPMLMLFSGLQMAGPHLTPESFAAGLLRTKWANPPHRNMPGKVTVGPGTHSFMEDASIIWWNPAFYSEDYAQRGGFCYFDGGRRFRLGQYPKSDPGLFQGRCGRGLD